MLRTAILTASVVLVAVRPSTAGDCSSGGPDVVEALESYAKSTTKKAPEIWDLCVEQSVAEDPRLTKRFLAACETIVARDPKDASCIRYSIELGAKKLGTFDLFDAVGTLYKIDPFQYQNTATSLYRDLGDPRAVPLLRAHWQAALTDKRAKSTKSTTQHNYTWFRHTTIKLMAKHGDKNDGELIASQLNVTKDASLKKAMQKALAAIDKRVNARP